MGGNALKNTVTRRYEKAEYEVLRDQVLHQLRTDFPKQKIADIPAYRTKPSFGDLDILMETEGLTINLLDYIKTRFQPNEIYANNHVYSFDYQQFQIDIIGSSSADFDISLNYFAWNDLGNIIGRLYHKMGFKYGHDGLTLIVRDGNYIMGEISLSKDITKILQFAELDPERFKQGFDTLEDIFLYSASSPYFNKQIYLFDNRNHASRIRDKKRATYNALLKWLETQDNLNAYEWDSMREHGGRQIKELFLQRAFDQFPHAKPQYEALLQEYERKKRIQGKFNGGLVMELTGLEGKKLGNFMQYLRAQGQIQYNDFMNWLDNSTSDIIKQWVLDQWKQYQ